MRTVPASILALQGVPTTRAPIFLVEIRWPSGTGYYSSGDAVSFGGNSYVANRVTVSNIEAGLIDRKHREFSRIEITLDNLADTQSSSFPFTVLEAASNPEDSLVFLHIYSPDAATALPKVVWGYLGARRYNGDDKTASYTVSFFWDALDSLLPTKLVHQSGFDVTEGAAQLSEDGTEEMCIPVVYGAGALKIRPLIYSHWTEGQFLHVNFIVTGCNGQPMAAAYLTGANLWGTTQATATEILLGSAGQGIPANRTRFPDGAAHPNVAYGYATFAIKDEDKNRADDLKPNDIKANITNGRPLIDTTLPSENAALILKDFLRDPNFSTGLPSALFDSITSTANYVGTRYQMRFEFHEQVSVTETVQYILANFHGYVTFENGLIQIKAKRNDETSVATFATVDGGGGQRKIHDDFVDVSIKDSSELVNKFSIKYRRKKRNRRWVTLFDPVAQARAGGTQKKEVEDELDQWENGGVYDEAQAAILAAIAIREDQNGNAYASWSSPIWDCIDVSVGDLVQVITPDMFGNASNRTFRVTKQTFDTDPGGLPLVHFEGQIYKAAIYNDDSVALGVDLLRGGDFTDAQGRPPDVIPVSLSVVDVVTEDVEGRMADMLAVWTYPVVDLATEQADGLFREFPISEVEIWWRWTDESINAVRRAGSVKFPTAQLNFQIDFKKSKTVEAFFVAIGHNRARSPLGYVPDKTKVTALTANLSATGLSASVVGVAGFTASDYVIIEKEIARLTSGTPAGTTLNFVGAVNRLAHFDTSSIAHPTGTEISVAKVSYPSLIRPLITPRFTYRVVTGLVARQKPDGVRTKWLDVNTDNREVYYLYWSADADAGTNPAKLGISNPAWYLTDPNSPPVGINLAKNDDLSHLIDQADIGGAGVPVSVRVSARNGKHNWSATLSVLATNAAGGSAIPPPTDAPSTPSLALIISQGPNLSTLESDSLDVFRVFASQANNALTFAQTGTAELILIFRDAASTKDDNWIYVIDDTSLTFVDVPIIGTLGKSRIHRRNVASNGAGGKTKSPVVAIPFFSGGRVSSLTGITGLVITSVVPVANTKGRRSDVHWAFTQASPPNGPGLVAKAIVMQKNSAEAAFTKESKEGLLDEETLQTAGAKTPLPIRVSHPKNDAGQYKIRLVSVDGTLIESGIFNSTSQDEDTAAPNNGVAITIKRARLKNGGVLVCNYELPVLQMNTYDKSVLVLHDNNSTGAGRRFYDPFTSTWVATYPDGSTELTLARGTVNGLKIRPSEIYVGGRTQFFVKIGVWNRFNGGTATYSPDLPAAGFGLITQAASEADSLGSDTLAPNGGVTMAAPSVKFGPLGMRVKFDTPATHMNSHTKNTIRLFVADASVGCHWNGLNGADRVTSVAAIDIDIGKSNDKTFNISKADAQAAFVAQFGVAAVATKVDALYTISNLIGPTFSSVKSKNLATEATSIVSLLGAVDLLDIRATMTSPANIAPNGDFVRELTGFPGELERWRRWNGTSFPIDTQAQQITNASAQIDWAQTNNAVRVRSANTFQLVGQLKRRLKPGETYNLTCVIRSSVAGSWASTLRFHFYNGGRAGLVENMEVVPNCALTFPDTNYQFVQTAFRMKQVPDLPTVAFGADYAEHWLGIEFTVRTNDIFIDLIMMVRGEQPLLYAPRPNEQDDMAIVPTFISTPDIVTIGGVPGRVNPPGFGGRINL